MTQVYNPETGELIQDELGREVPDPNPMEVPLGMKRPATLAEQVQRLVRHSLSAYADMKGDETFEEADDFEVDDDFDPYTPYETNFDPILGKELTPADFANAERRQQIKEAYLVAERNAMRAEEFQETVDALYKAHKRPPKGQKREAAEGAAPASSPPAEPQSGK